MTTTQKAALILSTFFVFEGSFVAWAFYPHPSRFLRYLGFLPGRHVPAPIGWLAASLVAALFIWVSSRLPSVRANFFALSGLKLLALGVAVVASILEEWAFRGILMDAVAAHATSWSPAASSAAQVVLSGLAFGLLHAVWALFRGRWQAGIGAMAATGGLGAALAVVYLVCNRSLAPAIAAHFLINALCEPGLVLAAVRGEMRRPNAREATI